MLAWIAAVVRLQPAMTAEAALAADALYAVAICAAMVPRATTQTGGGVDETRALPDGRTVTRINSMDGLMQAMKGNGGKI